ncbi:unnamed protein product [Linum trigynum]|uniref:Uncharacterized protein n=1 Tax=Linum trigynum TaxID=586398 RepID=A0AAV2GL14_9ROSI
MAAGRKVERLGGKSSYCPLNSILSAKRDILQQLATWVMLIRNWSSWEGLGNRRRCSLQQHEKFHHIHGGGGTLVLLYAGGLRLDGYSWSTKSLPSSYSTLSPDSQIPLPPITSFPDVLEYNPQRRNFEFVHRLDGDQRLAVHGRTFFQERFFWKTAVSAEPTTEVLRRVRAVAAPPLRPH